MAQSATQATAQVTPADRLIFTFFLAIVVHATLILGVGFSPEKAGKAPHTIDVTIAYHKTGDEPDEADFIAQRNQQGSGDQTEKQELTTTELADFEDNKIQQVRNQEKTVREANDQVSQTLIVTTSGISPRKVNTEKKVEKQPAKAKQAEEEKLEEISREIASLEARLDKQKQAYAKRPRIRRLTSVSAKASYEAIYIEQFSREIEEMGTRNFPHQALQQNSFGTVRLLVALLPNGTVKQVEILKPSGYSFLDKAAVQSVRLAAPFAPFTVEMKNNMDILEIIRTWKFDRKQVVTTH